MSALIRVRLFLLFHVCILCLSVTVIMMTNKLELHLWFNQWHSPSLDFIFRFATRMAEGWFIGIVVFLAMLYKLRVGAAGLVGIVAAGLTTQFLKRMVFSDHLRPSKVFANITDLHFVDGVVLHGSHSFPSGHATGAFALFIFCAWAINKRWAQLTFYALALITAYSRVYLSQHFFEDIVVGSIIGITVCMGIISMMERIDWGEKGLLELIGIKPPIRES